MPGAVVSIYVVLNERAIISISWCGLTDSTFTLMTMDMLVYFISISDSEKISPKPWMGKSQEKVLKETVGA